MRRSIRRRARRLRTIVFEIHRPHLVAALIAGNCLAVALNVHLFRIYHKTPLDLARGVWTYGPLGIFEDATPPPIRLSDPATFHMSCGPECSMRRPY